MKPPARVIANRIRIASVIVLVVALAAITAVVYWMDVTAPNGTSLFAWVAITAIVALVGIFLWNQTALTRKIAQQKLELAGLSATTKELNTTVALNSILQRVATEAVRATGADFCSISLADANALEFSPVISLGMDDANAEISSPTAKRALRTATPQLQPDSRADAAHTLFPASIRSELAVPIHNGELLAGIIHLAAKTPHAFNETHLPFIETLAHQSAIAIRQSQEFEARVKERLANITRLNQLARLSELNRMFRANLPLDDVLEEIAFAVQETSGFNVTLISVVENQQLHHIAVAGLPLVRQKQLRSTVTPIEMLHTAFKSATNISSSYFLPAEAQSPGQLNFSLQSFATPAEKAVPGVWQPADLLFTPLRDIQNDLIGLLTVSNPVDESRPTLETVAALELFANQAAIFVENTRQFQRLSRQATRLQLISEIHTRMSTIFNPAELIGEVAQLIAGTFNYYHVQIFLVDQQSPHELVLGNCAGSAKISRNDDILRQRLPIDENSAIGWAAKRKQTIRVNDTAKESRFNNAAAILPETQSEMVVPILINQSLYGVIDIQHNETEAFSGSDAASFETLAGQMAVAIQNAQLFDEALQRERLSSALGTTGLALNATLDPTTILDVICREALRAFRVDGVLLWMVARNGKKLVIEAAAGSHAEALIGTTVSLDNEDIVAVQVIHNQRASFVNDISHASKNVHPKLKNTAGAQSMIALPLIAGQQLASIGAIVLFDTRHPFRFDVQDQISIALLANQAAIAIENAQLVDQLNKFNEQLENQINRRTKELREERDRVEALYNIARELSSSLDIDRVLNEALNLIHRTIPVTRGTILLVDDATGYLNYRAAIGRPRGLPRGGKLTRYKQGVGLAGKAMELRSPILVSDLRTNPDWIPDEKPELHRAALVVPLIAGYEMVGVLMLFHTEAGYFTPDHLRFVSAVAPIIATAVNNAGLYNLISQQVQRLGELLGTVQAEARKSKAIIEGTDDGMLLLDAEQSIQLINQTAAALLDIDPETATGQPLAAFVSSKPADDTLASTLIQQLNTIINQADTHTKPHRVEIDNHVILLLLSEVTITLNMPPSMLVVLRDITREAELDRMKDEFVSTVSHELRTPMTSIKGYTDLLASGKIGELTEMQQKFINIIKGNADRLSALVNDILDVSRIDTGRVRLSLEFFNVVTVIDDVITSLERQIIDKNLTVSKNISPELPPVFADANRVTQILVNLVGNAVKYTNANDSIYISAVTDGSFVKISVQDTGLGIAEEDVQQVFNRFFRAERDASSLVDGTGLGLSIAKMFTELMGGKIWVESKLGKGSTFSFTLPTVNWQTSDTSILPQDIKEHV